MSSPWGLLKELGHIFLKCISKKLKIWISVTLNSSPRKALTKTQRIHHTSNCISLCLSSNSSIYLLISNRLPKHCTELAFHIPVFQPIFFSDSLCPFQHLLPVSWKSSSHLSILALSWYTHLQLCRRVLLSGRHQRVRTWYKKWLWHHFLCTWKPYRN